MASQDARVELCTSPPSQHPFNADFKLLHCDILAGGGPVHTTTIDCRCPAKHRPAPRGFSALLSGGGPEHITNY